MNPVIRSLLGIQPKAEIEKPVRRSDDARAELESARGSSEQIARKTAEAGEAQRTARRQYDIDVEVAATSGGPEPDRGNLEACITRADALRRVEQGVRKRVIDLQAEVAKLQLAEAIAEGRETLPELISDATAKLSAFEDSIRASAAAERALFGALFDEHAGLKKSFASEELRREAARVRRDLRTRAMDAARRIGYAISPRFETDGELNLGAEEDFRDTSAWARRRTPDPPPVWPRDVGELVHEDPIDHSIQPIRVW